MNPYEMNAAPQGQPVQPQAPQGQDPLMQDLQAAIQQGKISPEEAQAIYE